MAEPIENKAAYYFGDSKVLERAPEENEFEGSRVEEEDMEQLLRIQEQVADLPSFWKNLLTKLVEYSKTPIINKCITDDNISGLELSFYNLEERVYDANPCQINLVKEIVVDPTKYFFDTKIFRISGVPTISEIPDLDSAVFCYLVHNKRVLAMDKYQTSMVFVREDEVDPLPISNCPDWRALWTEALAHRIDRRCIEDLCNWSGSPQRIVTFDDGSTIIVQKAPNEFYLIKQCLVCTRKWRFGNYKTPYNGE